MYVLGIETSCDETAAAVVDADRRILSNIVLTQLEDHRPYGGVVPEVAARAHLKHLTPIVRKALAEAGLNLADIDGVAATAGPGLIGGVMVGTTAAKAMAFAAGKPFLAINHLEGHALTPRLTDDVAFPYLLLLVSGGHCQLLIVEGVGRYRRLGTTMDDAVGEAFDKVAKCLGLGYPGGPALERAAADGDPESYDLPRPLIGRAGCEFSFSGLKTAVRQIVDRQPPGPLTYSVVADLAASFQAAAADALADRTGNALAIARKYLAQQEKGLGLTALVVAGGVAANRTIRTRLAALAETDGLPFVAPPLALCTDNGAMIAWAGVERLRLGLVDGLDARARPRWPLDPDATPVAGAGVKA
ncbi:tRNA (adenosine(37)-N6)-threonylcarbamoyltransferase complex transferase subunit TsaD [Fodinicurvata sp. EGI_FJ10296]|uniref:tRNA (adenosine(37)-N6)-threonylcarbamoyltransferase complex transferase subunit TsaD n=1 Tax=Fodinicurvata sp. EGI_FJ10296 TaxID=3231908 RepID=UPI003452825F